MDYRTAYGLYKDIEALEYHRDRYEMGTIYESEFQEYLELCRKPYMKWPKGVMEMYETVKADIMWRLEHDGKERQHG